MMIEERSFQHPQQASQVRLAVYEQAAGTSAVEGMPDEAGFLATEEWRGAGTVVKTLGFYPDREGALRRLESRARELELQRYRPIAPTA